MATVGFLRGLSSALPSSSSDGKFYITTDTYELYYSDGSSLHKVNAADSSTTDSGWVAIDSATSVSMTSKTYTLTIPDAAKAFNTLHIQTQIKPQQGTITITPYVNLYVVASGGSATSTATSEYVTKSYSAGETCLCDIYLTRESSMCTKDIYVDGALVNHEVIPTLGSSPTYGSNIPSFPRDSSVARWDKITFKSSIVVLSAGTDNYYIITGKGANLTAAESVAF